MNETKTKKIIACLDIKDGAVVKGVNFVNLRPAGGAVELARFYDEQGADELVFLDIAATVEQRKTMVALASQVAKAVKIPFTVGGGIASVEDAGILLAAGASKISLNSAAIKNPKLISDIAKKYGSKACVCAIDAKEEGGVWQCYTSGGNVRADKELLAWAKEAQDLGAGEILFTSMSHDGVKTGFPNEALAKLKDVLSIPLTASGGAGRMEDFRDAFIIGRADAALAASVLHFGEVKIPELKAYLRGEGIEVSL